jgi:glycosyltransferase involved in cell wall biosynthesis
MHTPLVSVVIPTHNRPHFLAQAIDSVRAQTFTDYEIIVVSNGERADPASRSIAAGCRYFQLAEGNVSRARNVGVEQAQGEWIAFLDDDDLWLPSKLERQLAEAQSSGADMITCDYVEFSLNGSEIVRQPRLIEGWSHTKALNYMHWWALPSATMLRRGVLDKTGGFDPLIRYSEDGDMWRRASWHHSIHHIEETLVRYRSGHASMMQQERRRYLYDIYHYRKMRRDTPLPLRSTLPPTSVFVLPRLAMIILPRILRNWLHLAKPRRRWLKFRQWLRPRTRVNAIRAYFRI